MLTGYWMKAMVILLLILLILFGLGALENGYRLALSVPMLDNSGNLNTKPVSLLISLAFTVLTLLFLPPLIMGQTEWFWSLSEHKEPKVGDIFGWFGSLKLYLKSVWLMLNLFVRYLLWSVLLCCIPVGLIEAGTYYGEYFGGPSGSSPAISVTVVESLLTMTGLVLLIGALFCLLFILMRYFPAVFLLAEDNTRKVREVIRSSVRYSRGYRWETTKFLLSFILWLLTCYFIIPVFYVGPYLFASSTIFAKHIIYTQRAKERENDAPADQHGPDHA